jgi:hypothetical protein
MEECGLALFDLFIYFSLLSRLMYVSRAAALFFFFFSFLYIYFYTWMRYLDCRGATEAVRPSLGLAHIL